MTLQIRRTATPDAPPPNGSLAPGQLAVEMASSAPRLWVGTAAALGYTGNMRLVIDSATIPSLPLSIANGGTGATSLSGVGGVLDRSSLLYSNGTTVQTTPNWGIYTGNPALFGSAHGGDNANDLPIIAMSRTRGTITAPAAVQTGDILGGISVEGYPYAIVASEQLSAASIYGIATQTHTATAHGTSLRFQVTADGATGPSTAMTINQDRNLTLNVPLGIASGGTGSSNLNVGATSGAILVSNANGPVTANQNMFVDASGMLSNSTAGTGIAPTFVLRAARGNYTTRAAVQSTDWLGVLYFAGYSSPTVQSNQASIVSNATQNWAAGARGANMFFQVTPNGTTALQTAMTINHDTTINLANSLTTMGGLIAQTTGNALTLPNGNISFGNAAGVNGIQFLRYASNFISFGWYSPTTGGMNMMVDGVDSGMIQITASDERIKRRIGPVSVDALEALRKVELHSFDRMNVVEPERPGIRHEVGVVAQQLKKVIPEAVLGEGDELLSLDLLPLVAYCVRAIQQLAERD